MLSEKFSRPWIIYWLVFLCFHRNTQTKSWTSAVLTELREIKKLNKNCLVSVKCSLVLQGTSTWTYPDFRFSDNLEILREVVQLLLKKCLHFETSLQSVKPRTIFRVSVYNLRWVYQGNLFWKYLSMFDGKIVVHKIFHLSEFSSKCIFRKDVFRHTSIATTSPK